MFAAEIRRKRVNRVRAFTHWRWRLDEVFVKINGQNHALWRPLGKPVKGRRLNNTAENSHLPFR